MRRYLRDKWTSWIRDHFEFFEKYLKIHVLPANYLSPVPQKSDLSDRMFARPFSCRGVRMNLEEQLHLLDVILPRYLEEYTPRQNPGLSLLDDYVLYAFIRHFKPRRMIEIGSGCSTQVSLKALSRNRSEGASCHFTAIEPFPPPTLQVPSQPGFELLRKPVQSLSPAYFETCDLLFIDSSHICKMGSDVTMQILEIIPQLPPKALVHWHDITIPHNYWKEWASNKRLFWNESYMVHAFMLFNDSFQTLWSAQYLQTHHAHRLLKAFPFFIPARHRLSSFWIQRTQNIDPSAAGSRSELP